MIAALIGWFIKPEFFGILAVVCAAGYFYFKATLQPLFALICEIAAVVFLVLTAYAWADNRGYARAEASYKPKLEKAEAGLQKAEADLRDSRAAELRRQHETQQCVDASVLASAAVVMAQKRAAAAQDESARLVAAARAMQKQHASYVAQLKAGAAAAPKAQACPQELHDADATVDEALARHREVTK